MTKNLKQLLIKASIFFILIVIIKFLINSILATFPIYDYWRIPREFFPASSGMLARVGIIISIAFILLNKDFFSKNKVPKTPLKDSIIFGILTIADIAIYYLYRFIIKQNLEFALNFKVLFIPLIYVFMVGFPVLLFISVFGLRYFKSLIVKFYKQIIIFIISGTIIYFLLIYIQSLWIYLSHGVGKALYYGFSLIYDNVLISFKTEGPLLVVQGFAAIIGDKCSGIDSLLMFSSLYAFIFFLDYQKINKKRALIIFPIGLIGTYLFNILRIFLLYLTGIYVSPEFAIGLFHQNIGWVLFIVYFFMFWYFASNKIYCKKD